MRRAASRHQVVPLLALIVALAVAPSTAACRCAETSLDESFAAADLVVLGRATAVRVLVANGEARRHEVDIEPLFRQGRPFKGDLSGLTLATPASTAACGLPVVAGETYLLFADRQPDTTLAWFTTCSGSRLYAGGSRAGETAPFPGLPVNRIVPRLFELAQDVEQRGETTAPQASAVPDFHVSPACWAGPRIHHSGPPSGDLRQRVTLAWSLVPEPAEASAETTVSPNGAYRAWVRNPDTSRAGPWDALVVVDTGLDQNRNGEHPRRRLTVELSDVAGPVRPQWINEKLLFLRVPWGRIVWSDLILDTEAGVWVYQEQAIHGSAAFEQYQEACAGQCPCLAQPGTASATEPVPAHGPARGDSPPAAALAETLVAHLAYLNDAWDGRVFSQPGEPLHTVSAVPRRDDGEVAADILAVRRAGGALWLEVALYALSPCGSSPTAPPPRPVHRGWVPAYSPDGRLVAGVHPGGC